MKTLRPQYGLLGRRWTIRNMIRDIPHIPTYIYVGGGVSRINISYGPTPDPSHIFLPLITGSMKALRLQYGLLGRCWTIRNMIRDIPHIPTYIYVGGNVSRINISYGPTPDPSRIFSPLITGSMKTLRLPYGLLVRRWTIRNMIRDIPSHIYA